MAYKIGDKAHGGIVFCLFQDGEHGLVAAETDHSTRATWEDAMKICSDLKLGGYRDWFLPSKDLLILMWKNLHRYGCPEWGPCPTALGGFVDDMYWSSEEFDTFDAYRYNFRNGSQNRWYKPNELYVRAVRAF